MAARGNNKYYYYIKDVDKQFNTSREVCMYLKNHLNVTVYETDLLKLMNHPDQVFKCDFDKHWVLDNVYREEVPHTYCDRCGRRIYSGSNIFYKRESDKLFCSLRCFALEYTDVVESTYNPDVESN